MQKFRADGNGAIHYTVDFRTDDFANISFLEAPGGDILFHLSLRESKQLAVTNARRDGKWQGEAATEVSLAKHGDRIIIRFSDAGVQVDLNGTAIITDNARYPGTELISVMQFTGGLIEESFWIEGDGNACRQTSGSLQFIAPCNSGAGAAIPVLLVQRPEIRVEGTAHPLRSERQARPELAKRHNVRRR